MTNKQNFETSRYETENQNVIRVVDTYELPRYTGSKSYDCQFACDDTVENIKDQCKIYVPRGDYTSLTTFEINYDDLDGKTLEEDREIFQKKLDEEFGKDKYEAFVLGAYIHSGTSFSVNKTGNHVCHFDSSQLGFIGLQKGTDDYYSAEHPDRVADDLTAAWNGEFVEYTVTDELTGDVVDGIVSADYHEQNEFEKKCLEQYGVDFDKIEATY